MATTALQHTDIRIWQRRHQWRPGLTLVELLVSSTISLLLIATLGLLIDTGNRAWVRTYDNIHSDANADAVVITTTFGSIGRRANRTNYVLYQMNQGSFIPVTADSSDDDIVLSGDAVEFRYWDITLDQSDSAGIMDTDVTATAYALFYLEGDQLKVDYGPYPPGAVPSGGGARNTTDVTTRVLAENVSACSDIGPFSHTVSSGTGQGCVRLNLIVTDPNNDNETTTVTSAALMRNIWPR